MSREKIQATDNHHILHGSRLVRSRVHLGLGRITLRKSRLLLHGSAHAWLVLSGPHGTAEVDLDRNKACFLDARSPDGRTLLSGNDGEGQEGHEVSRHWASCQCTRFSQVREVKWTYGLSN